MHKVAIKWATTTFDAGDVLIFGMYLLHSSLENTTNQYRISLGR
ncbi:phytanoyl-CoA dioxygenase family protein [Paenibacillus alginolyticus]|nr:phytanoyl-CoA dioxygenase family protein [Paenibacillus alginolyticus]MEC0141876.1 phytanoyl-CoA dioxygenase family protein [Paenibacillus alginolyticus]